MEFFNRAKAVRLKSLHDKFLIADENEETVRQSRNGSSRRARWTVEFIPGNTHVIRLKSFYGKYLTATDEPFLLGMTGKKVVQDMPTSRNDTSAIDWEPRTERYYVKLRTKFGGKYLRANGGMPPWRNSITHDVPHRTATQDWILWTVDVIDILESDSIPGYISPASSFSSSFSSDFAGSDECSETSWSSLVSTKSSSFGHDQYGKESPMEFFRKAKSVRLKSHHDKYLIAEDDQENVNQDRNGTIRNVKWEVEFGNNADVIRLKSCYGKYLTASNMPFLLGMTGKKVLQTLPRRLDSSVEWEPIREGFQVKLKTRYGQYLRANGGLPPWRNSVTHDIPHRSSTQDWILWDVDMIEIRPRSPSPPPQQEPADEVEAPDYPGSPTSFSSPRLSRIESDDSYVVSPIKNEGRVIYYRLANEHGDVEENDDELSFHFKGSVVDELKQKLGEEIGIHDILVCSKNPLNQKLYPLRLHLPPNNATMHVVVVPSSSKDASKVVQPGSATAM